MHVTKYEATTKPSVQRQTAPKHHKQRSSSSAITRGKLPLITISGYRSKLESMRRIQTIPRALLHFHPRRKKMVPEDQPPNERATFFADDWPFPWHRRGRRKQLAAIRKSIRQVFVSKRNSSTRRADLSAPQPLLFLMRDTFSQRPPAGTGMTDRSFALLAERKRDGRKTLSQGTSNNKSVGVTARVGDKTTSGLTAISAIGPGVSRPAIIT